jgi:LacI family transcriptional regulator
MSTIYDVAREAGVSIGTVSYVLNGRGRISQDTIERVRQAMDKLNYQPRQAAKALAQGHTNSIALVAPARIYDYQMGLSKVIDAIGGVLAKTDYRLLIHLTLDRPDAWRELEEPVRGKQMDGVILMHVAMQDPRVDLLQQAGMPFVMIGRTAETGEIPYVDADIEACAQLAVDYLYRQGYQRISMIGETGEAAITNRLLKGFCGALESAGLPCPPEAVINVSGTPEDARQAARSVLQQPNRPNGIFALSDSTVLGVYNAAHDLNLSIPRDLAVLGYADSPLYPHMIPPVSAVFGSMAEMGEEAAQLLLLKLDNDTSVEDQVLIPPAVVERGSTCPA